MVVAEIELSYNPTLLPCEMPEIGKSLHAYELFRDNWNAGKMHLQEQFKIMLLNAASRVLGIYECSSGGISGTVADVRIIFAAALKASAARIILCHNHPSGNLKPSECDKRITHKLQAAGKILEIQVTDHIIITSGGFFSFSDEGLL